MRPQEHRDDQVEATPGSQKKQGKRQKVHEEECVRSGRSDKNEKERGRKARQAEKHLCRVNGVRVESRLVVKSQTMLKNALKKTLFLPKWFSCLLLGSVIIPLLWLF